MRRVFLFLIIACILPVFFSISASAANVRGVVYDLYLNKQSDSMVEINTLPKQMIISKDGTYSFEVAEGNYVITAKYSEGSMLNSYVEENITIVDDGDYVIDLVLFPVLENEEEVVDMSNLITENNRSSFLGLLIWSLVAIVVIIVFFYLFYKFKSSPAGWFENRKPNDDGAKPVTGKYVQDGLVEKDLKEDILQYISQNGGRVTQKDIRRKFPSSEAKISLVLTELEHKGSIEKIKKGRGNIIILK